MSLNEYARLAGADPLALAVVEAHGVPLAGSAVRAGERACRRDVDAVVAAAAEDPIRAVATVDRVAAVAAIKPVAPGVAVEVIAAVGAVDAVVAELPAHGVAPGAAVDAVVIAGAGGTVVAAEAEDAVAQARAGEAAVCACSSRPGRPCLLGSPRGTGCCRTA